MVFLTHDSVLANEDVDNSNILLPGIVKVTLAGNVQMLFLKVLPLTQQ